MKKSVMEKWVAALRSGEYKQGNSYLSKNGNYCCLGVLCDLAAKDGVCKKTQGIDDVTHFSFDESGGKGNDEFLPKSVQEWAGMKNNKGMVNGENSDLTMLNDIGVYMFSATIKCSFEDIANIIEDNYKEL